jgi:argininosuccinate lyase
MPFRDAYKKVGMDIQAGKFSYTPAIKHTHEGSIGYLATEEIKKQMQKLVESFPFKSVQTAIANLLN